VPTSESACIKSFCNLFDLLTANIKFDPKDPKDDRESYLNYIEKWFVFAIIWSVGVTVESESREFIDSVIREISSFIPLDGTVFDYLINTERKEFQKWAEKIPKDEIKLLHNKRFHEIQVQTVDGVRNRFLVQTLLENPKT
jgi:dynein heavy chain